MKGTKRSGKHQGDEDFEPFIWYLVCQSMHEYLEEYEVESASWGDEVKFSRSGEDGHRISRKASSTARGLSS
jgi:hypothetical protein